MDINTIVAVCESMLDDPALREPENLAERADALDYIDFAEEALDAQARRYRATEDYGELRRALRALERDLHAINRAFYQQLQRRVRRGDLVGPSLRSYLDTFTDYRAGDTGHRHLSFDTLDTVINGLILADPVPEATTPLTPEMVNYQATPGSLILELVDRVALGPGVEFFDIGCGLGKVPILVHLLTGASALGIELDPVLCAYARAQARNLGLDVGRIVRFVNADARDIDAPAYRDGDVFYLFTPFTGSILRDVLTKLARRARRGEIVVCTHGPCTPTVAEETWLHNVDGNAQDPFKLAVFRSVRP